MNIDYIVQKARQINEGGEDMPLNADTDYPAFSAMLQRALRFDTRPNGSGADWKLGPTVWERLNQIEGKIAPVTGDQVKQIADAVIAAQKPGGKVDYEAIAKAVNDDAAERLKS